MSICGRSLHWDGRPPLCGEPAVAKTRAMCVHEHYGEGFVCAACLAEMRRLCDDAEWTCDECAEGAEPHECLMPMLVTVLDEVAP